MFTDSTNGTITICLGLTILNVMLKKKAQVFFKTIMEYSCTRCFGSTDVHRLAPFGTSRLKLLIIAQGFCVESFAHCTLRSWNLIISPIKVLYPFLGLADSGSIASNYIKNTNFLLIGAIATAIALETSQLHLRIAIATLKTIGCSPRRLLFGTVFISWFSSMWVRLRVIHKI